MNPLSILQIAELSGAKLEQGDGKIPVERISTDSRTIKKGELFVALRGENFDGHKFVEATAEAGAAGAIVDLKWNGKVPSKFVIIRGNDTLLAYQKLAANYRKALSIKVLAITGSNGKTSTKDFAASVLGRKFRVTKTQGNFNNHVGLPRTILEATSNDEVAVWEIGMNHPGEVAPLAKIAAPNAAIITNIGVAHIEFMGTRDAIAKEKGALAEAVAAEGAVILNGDDPFSKGIAERTPAQVIFAGTTEGTVRAIDIQQSADGRAFGLSLEEAAAGLASAPLTKARLQIKEINGVQFLDDSYNANPDSMKAALQTLVELDTGGKRIAVLGEMRDRGKETERGHEEVGEAAAAFGIDQLIGIGEMGATIARAADKAGLENSSIVGSTSEAADLLIDIAAPGDLVLIKGSRLARTEDVIEAFAKRSSPEGARV